MFCSILIPTVRNGHCHWTWRLISIVVFRGHFQSVQFSIRNEIKSEWRRMAGVACVPHRWLHERNPEHIDNNKGYDTAFIIYNGTVTATSEPVKHSFVVAATECQNNIFTFIKFSSIPQKSCCTIINYFFWSLFRLQRRNKKMDPKVVISRICPFSQSTRTTFVAVLIQNRIKQVDSRTYPCPLSTPHVRFDPLFNWWQKHIK